MIYENQTEVNAALKKVIPSVVKREELHLTSKLWNSSHQPAEVEKELDETLKQLGTPYLDLYCALTKLMVYVVSNNFFLSVIHWPVAFVPGKGLVPPHPSKEGEAELDLKTTLVDTWKAMIALPKEKVHRFPVLSYCIYTDWLMLGSRYWCFQLHH